MIQPLNQDTRQMHLDYDIPHSAWTVYKIIQTYMEDETDVCFPTIKTLSSYTKLSEKHVSKTLKILEQCGLISILKIDNIPPKARKKLKNPNSYHNKLRNFYKLNEPQKQPNTRTQIPIPEVNNRTIIPPSDIPVSEVYNGTGGGVYRGTGGGVYRGTGGGVYRGTGGGVYRGTGGNTDIIPLESTPIDSTPKDIRIADPEILPAEAGVPNTPFSEIPNAGSGQEEEPAPADERTLVLDNDLFGAAEAEPGQEKKTASAKKKKDAPHPCFQQAKEMWGKFLESRYDQTLSEVWQGCGGAEGASLKNILKKLTMMCRRKMPENGWTPDKMTDEAVNFMVVKIWGIILSQDEKWGGDYYKTTRLTKLNHNFSDIIKNINEHFFKPEIPIGEQIGYPSNGDGSEYRFDLFKDY